MADIEQPAVGDHVSLLRDRGGHNNVHGEIEQIDSQSDGTWIARVDGAEYPVARWALWGDRARMRGWYGFVSPKRAE
jgi:hypothetical protein